MLFSGNQTIPVTVTPLRKETIMSRKEIMRKRRLVTYSVGAAIVIVAIVIFNVSLAKSQMESLKTVPNMVWYNGVLIEESVADSFKEEAQKPVVFTDNPVLVYASDIEVPKDVVTVAPVSAPVTKSSRRVDPIKVTSEEYSVLLKIGMAEAAGEPIEGVRAVYTVILNRVAKKHQGENTILGVIYKPYQFSGVGVGQWDTKPSDKIIEALNDVLNGYRSFEEEILFYHYDEAATDRAQVNRVKVLYTIGVHDFGVLKEN